MGADDLGDITNGDVAAALAEQDGFTDVVKIAELVAGAHQIAGFGFVEAATGLVEVLGKEPGVDLVDREPKQGEATLVDADLDLFFIAAVDLDSGDALGGLEILLDQLLRDIAQLIEAVAAREIQSDHGVVGRVEPHQHRPVGRARQGRKVEFLAHVEGGEIHVAAPAELQRHLRETGATPSPVVGPRRRFRRVPRWAG